MELYRYNLLVADNYRNLPHRKIDEEEIRRSDHLLEQYLHICCICFMHEIEIESINLDKTEQYLIVTPGQREKKRYVVGCVDQDLQRKVFNDISSTFVRLYEAGLYESYDLLDKLEQQLTAEGMALEPASEVGICCFCGGDCNPASQCCGRCARSMYL